MLDDVGEPLDLGEAALPSSRTVCGSSAAAIISSSRIDSAVSGVRSWCEASLANCRSAAISRSTRRAAVEQLGDPVDLGDPDGRPSGRGSPDPSVSAASASSRPAGAAGLQHARGQPASATATAISGGR